MDKLAQLHNSGISVLNDAPVSSEMTIIVVGIARSGTSMIAGALDALGIFMGDRADRAVFEDVAIANALEQHPALLPDQIKKYNSRYAVWGFKRPAAFNYIDRYLHLFRNPRVIITYRDPAAIAKRNEISMVTDFRQQLLASSQYLVSLSKFVGGLEVPALVVSYEKALLAPEMLIAELCRFVGVPATSTMAQKASATVSNGSEMYLKASQVRFDRF